MWLLWCRRMHDVLRSCSVDGISQVHNEGAALSVEAFLDKKESEESCWCKMLCYVMQMEWEVQCRRYVLLTFIVKADMSLLHVEQPS